MFLITVVGTDKAFGGIGFENYIYNNNSLDNCNLNLVVFFVKAFPNP
jgi:hypothetical protein